MNIADSERFRTILRSLGLEEASSREEADLIVFNTCSVKQSAENRIYGLSGAINTLKSQNSNLKIVLTGCMARREFKKSKDGKKHKKLIAEIKSRAPWIDIVIETTEFNSIADELGKLGIHLKNLEKNEKAIFEPHLDEADKFLNVQRTPLTSATSGITISHGCDHMCSYCIVPFARGREIPRSVEPILNEVKDALNSGSNDIILLGQTVNRWINPDFQKEYLSGNFIQTRIENLNKTRMNDSQSQPKDFLQLLETIDELDGDFWLSFMSSHPNYFTKELIDFIAESVKRGQDKSGTGHMRPYIHLALQSGNDEMLNKMRRNHQIGEFIEKVEYMRETIPEVAISTDIIVGFSGETEEQFQDTMDVCKRLEFDQIFISEYSQREGTGSSFMKDDVPHSEKAHRKDTLNELLKITALKNNEKLQETTQKVLVTNKKRKHSSNKASSKSTGKTITATYQGRTAHNKLVQFEYSSQIGESKDSIRIGEFVDLKIKSITPWALQGQLIGK